MTTTYYVSPKSGFKGLTHVQTVAAIKSAFDEMSKVSGFQSRQVASGNANFKFFFLPYSEMGKLHSSGRPAFGYAFKDGRIYFANDRNLPRNLSTYIQHEVGHVWRRNHTKDDSSVMSESAKATKLGPTDIAFLVKKFGKPVDPNEAANAIKWFDAEIAKYRAAVLAQDVSTLPKMKKVARTTKARFLK